MRNWNEYKGRVLERVRLSCDMNVWPFQYQIFPRWLNNFRDGTDSPNKDEILALYLLDRLVVRTTETAKSGYSRLIACDLRQSFIEIGIIPPETTIEKLKNTLRTNPRSLEVMFLPITAEGDIGDSGPALIRHIHPVIKTNQRRLAKPKAVVYIDDCLASGEQFRGFIASTGPHESFPESQIYYCPLIAYKPALTQLQQDYPNIKIMPVELLDEDVFPFEENEYSSVITQHLELSMDELREHYQSMFKRYCGAKGYRPTWNGRSGICMPIVFEWGCPNSTPGVLHMESSNIKDSWKPLFSRRA